MKEKSLKRGVRRSLGCIVSFIYHILNQMNFDNKKRDKFRKQIRKKEIQDTFKQMRQTVLKQREYMVEQTSDGTSLTNYIRTSLVKNEMLVELRERQLFDKLSQLLKTTQVGRQVVLVLVLLGNVLHDDVTLDEKEEIARLCLAAYEKQIFEDYIADKENALLTELYSIVNNLSSLCDILNSIDEKWSIPLEKIIITKLLDIIQEITKIVVGLKMLTEDEERLIQGCFTEMDRVLRRFLYFQEQYRSQLSTRFDRNTVYFMELLKIHHSILPFLESKPLIAILHQGLFQTMRTLSDQVTMSNFPLYFQSNEYISICLSQIVARNQDWQAIGLDILTNLLMDYKEPELLSIEAMINEKIISLGGIQFFKRFLIIDELLTQRLRLLQIWVCDLNNFQIFLTFLEDYWRYLVDFCCEVIRKDQSDDDTNTSLKILVVLGMKMEEKEPKVFQPYFQSIGGMSLIDELRSRVLQASEGNRSIENTEVLDALSYYLENKYHQ